MDTCPVRKEKEHIKKALNMYGYPEWIIYHSDQTLTNEHEVRTAGRVSTYVPSTGVELVGLDATVGQDLAQSDYFPIQKKKRYPVVIPYIKGLSEEIYRTLKQHHDDDDNDDDDDDDDDVDITRTSE